MLGLKLDFPNYPAATKAPGHDRFYPELEANILNFRFEAESILDDSLSLLEYLQEKFDQTYQEAWELVLIQFDLAADKVPETP